MKDKHVVVLAFPFGSHAAPLLELIQGIAISSPDVLFSFFSTSMSNKSLFSNKSYHNIKPYDVDDGLPKDYVFSNNPQEPVELFLKATPGNFKNVVDVVVTETGRKASCFVSDALLWFTGDIAQGMNVPWVPLWTAAPHSLLVHVETQLIRQKVPPSGWDENEIVEIIPEFSVRATDLPEGVVSGNLNSCFATMLYRMGKALPQATAVAINSFEDVHIRAVDELKSRFHKFLNVGPFTLKAPPSWMSDEHGCLEWLDQHDYASVAYISFGRVITPPPHELIALAEALEESGVPFLWSFRGDAEEKLPKGFLQRTSRRGKILPWAAQLLVLAHPSVGVFVTHCGWNSILESIIAGVPMICRPFFGDQKLNMRTLEKVWGFGVGVEGGVFTKNGAKKALELSLLSKQGKEMREKIRGLKENAYRAVGSDGSSSKNFNTLIDIVTK